MDRNIKIAKQLVKIAKELVSSRSRTAIGMMVPWMMPALIVGELVRYEEVNTFDEFTSICKDVDPNTSACCLIPRDGNAEASKHYFNAYGAPFVIFFDKSNKIPTAIYHKASNQFKNISDDMTVSDERLLKTGAMLLVAEVYGSGKRKWSDVKSECVGDFSKFEKYIDEAQEQWGNGDSMEVGFNAQQ